MNSTVIKMAAGSCSHPEWMLLVDQNGCQVGFVRVMSSPLLEAMPATPVQSSSLSWTTTPPITPSSSPSLPVDFEQSLSTSEEAEPPFPPTWNTVQAWVEHHKAMMEESLCEDGVFHKGEMDAKSSVIESDTSAELEFGQFGASEGEVAAAATPSPPAPASEPQPDPREEAFLRRRVQIGDESSPGGVAIVDCCDGRAFEEELRLAEARSGGSVPFEVVATASLQGFKGTSDLVFNDGETRWSLGSSADGRQVCWFSEREWNTACVFSENRTDDFPAAQRCCKRCQKFTCKFLPLWPPTHLSDQTREIRQTMHEEAKKLRARPEAARAKGPQATKDD